MGVIGASLFTLAVLAGGVVLVALLEPLLQPAGAEPGPAGAVHPRPDRRARRTDPWLAAAGPVLALVSVAWGALVLPWGDGWIGADLNIGLFWFLVVVDLSAAAVAFAGWGEDTPASVEACYRAVAQLVAYVVPLGLAVIGPIMMAESLSTVDIVEGQRSLGLPYVVVQPLGFALFVVCAWMQTFRAPFLEPFADRIDRGVLGASGGWKALAWRVALSGLLFVVAGMGAALFLGGPAGPWLPGPVWMALKTAAMLALMVGLGSRIRPRSTADTLALAWRILVPVGLLNVLIVGGLILLGVH